MYTYPLGAFQHQNMLVHNRMDMVGQADYCLQVIRYTYVNHSLTGNNSETTDLISILGYWLNLSGMCVKVRH